MRTHAILFTLLPLLPLAACGEDCVPMPVITDPSVIISANCPDDDAGSAGDTSTGTTDADSASDTSASPTNSDTGSSGDSSTGDGVLPTCIALPGPGEAWGPCDDDGACSAGFCYAGELGSLCMPACEAEGCPSFKCFGGECRNDGACIPPCEVDADCPVPLLMVCDHSTPTPMCVRIDG